MTDNNNQTYLQVGYNNLLQTSDLLCFTLGSDVVYDSNAIVNSAVAAALSAVGTNSIAGTTTDSSGNVETMPVKSGGSLDDLWITSFIKSTSWKPRKVGFYLDGQAGYAEFSNVYVSGNIQALSGIIGGFTIMPTLLYGGTIQTGLTVGAGSNGVVMDSAGLRGYDSVLGMVFNIPTNGSAPTFSSGIINSTIFNVNTNAVIRTSDTVGDGSPLSYGVLVNNTGFYACQADQLLADANVRILINGTAFFSGTITGSTIIGGILETSTTGPRFLINASDSSITQYWKKDNANLAQISILGPNDRYQALTFLLWDTVADFGKAMYMIRTSTGIDLFPTSSGNLGNISNPFLWNNLYLDTGIVFQNFSAVTNQIRWQTTNSSSDYNAWIGIHDMTTEYQRIEFMVARNYSGGSTFRYVYLEHSGSSGLDFYPYGDAQGSLGLSGHRWFDIYAQNTHFGDVNFKDLYRMDEDEEFLNFYNSKTGEKIMKLGADGKLYAKDFVKT